MVKSADVLTAKHAVVSVEAVAARLVQRSECSNNSIHPRPRCALANLLASGKAVALGIKK